MLDEMEKQGQRSNPIKFRICAMMLSVALLLLCPFYVSEAKSVKPALVQTGTQSLEDEPTTSADGVNLNCTFIRAGPTYICRLKNLDVTTDVEVASVSGTHSPGKTNADVRGIHFKSGSMYYMPKGIEKFFPNLITLVAGDSYDSPISIRNIKRSSFRNLNELTLLSIFSDVITVVDDDAFWDLPILTDFLLSGNGTINLNEDAFNRNVHLREAVFLSTQLKNGIPKNLFRSNLQLEAVYFQDCSIKSIDEDLFAMNRNLNLVSFISNKLEYLPKNLFKNNLLLQVIDFSDNKLQTIDVDFTKFNIIDSIDLEDNACIDAFYETDAHRFDNAFTNLTELQNVIKSNCSCHSCL